MLGLGAGAGSPALAALVGGAPPPPLWPFLVFALGAVLAFLLVAVGRGLRRLTREACDALVTIPMPGGDAAGGVESLNVSVASGVALFEAVRQRQA